MPELVMAYFALMKRKIQSRFNSRTETRVSDQDVAVANALPESDRQPSISLENTIKQMSEKISLIEEKINDMDCNCKSRNIRVTLPDIYQATS